jgi:signal peptidase I
MVSKQVAIYGSFAVLVAVATYAAANISIALNGTTSLPHNGYAMLRSPLILNHGAIVAFETPEIVKAQFPNVSFIKRLVGKPGDVITSSAEEVCVNTECRKLEPLLVEKGFKPLPSGTVPAGNYVMFGDSADSLDSRYEIIGMIEHDDIIAAGVPINIPKWQEIDTWLEELGEGRSWFGG